MRIDRTQHKKIRRGVLLVASSMLLLCTFLPFGAEAQTTTPQAAAQVSATTTQQSGAAAATSAQNASSAGPDAADKGGKCGLGSFGDLGNCIVGALASIAKWIALFFLGLATLVLGVVGLVFNWTIYITVFQFGNLIGNNAGMLAAWGVLRDIGNIMLLFGFIFMGVSTILNLPGNEFTARRALPALIIFAILMNFSLFAAEFIIDASNGLGSTFYKQAGSGLCVEGETDLLSCATKYGIAGGFMQISGISAIFSPGYAKQIPGDDQAAAITIIGLTILAAVLAMVLLAAVFMFIIRACMLAFLMAVSPIGFAGMAIPILHRFAKMWWDQLLQQAFYAPVYLLLVLVSLKFMDGIRTALGSSDGQSFASVISGSGTSNASIFIVFILIIGFLLMATQAAKSMSAVGAGSATKWAGAAVFGGMARVTNTGFGLAARGGRIASRNIAAGANTDTRVGRIQRSLALGATSLFRKGENVNTDIRNWGPAGAALRGVAGDPSHNATFAGMAHQIHDVQKDMQKDEAESAKEANINRLLRNSKAHAIDEKDQRFLLSLSGEEIAANHDLSHAMHDLADQLSADQFEAYMKSDKISETEKGAARDTRYATLRTQIVRSDGGKIRKWSQKDLEQFLASPGFADMSETEKKEFISQLSDDQFDGLNKSSKVTNGQKAIFQDYRSKDRFDDSVMVNKWDAAAFGGKGGMVPDTDPITGAPMNRRERTLSRMSPSQRAKLDDDVVERVKGNLDPGDFDAIRRANKLNPENRAKVGTYVADALTDPRHTKHAEFSAYYSSLGPAGKSAWRSFYNLP